VSRPIFVKPPGYKAVFGKKSLWKAEFQLYLCDVDANPAPEPMTKTLNVVSDSPVNAWKSAVGLAMELGHYDREAGNHWMSVGVVILKLEWLADIDG
jgi:hypothetical protein